MLYGKRQQLRVVGTVLSPEYIYAVGPGQIFPDNRRFGVLWMGEEHLAASLDLTDAYNEILIRVDRGTAASDVIRKLDILLARYGGITAYPRTEQFSDRFVTNELAQLRTMTGILPPIFLGVAAFLINMVLSRLIDAEHEVIGLLMAFGYRGQAIMLHYAKIAVALSVPGLLLGIALGAWMGRGLAGMYQEYFVFPFLYYRAGLDIYAIASVVTIAVVLLGVFQSVRRVRRMTPVEAMRPPLPPNYAGGIARLLGRLRALDEPTRIIFRGILRRPFRSALGSLGVAAALGLYITSSGSADNVARMVEISFDQANRADVMVTFAEPRDQRALFELQRAPGVWRVEPLRVVGAKLSGARNSKSEGLNATSPGGDLNRLVGIDGAIIEPPVRGVLVSYGLSNELDLAVGDPVEVQVTEGRRNHFTLPVAAYHQKRGGQPGLCRCRHDRRPAERSTLAVGCLSGRRPRTDRRAVPLSESHPDYRWRFAAFGGAQWDRGYDWRDDGDRDAVQHRLFRADRFWRDLQQCADQPGRTITRPRLVAGIGISPVGGILYLAGRTGHFGDHGAATRHLVRISAVAPVEREPWR